MTELPEFNPEPQEETPKESQLVLRIQDLPPLQKGFVRLVHITAPESVDNIVSSGLNYETQGMISSTAIHDFLKKE